jgi:hypothetical protein
MGRQGYPPDFRRRVLDLIEAGRKVTDVARDLGISTQSISPSKRGDQPLKMDFWAGECFPYSTSESDWVLIRTVPIRPRP